MPLVTVKEFPVYNRYWYIVDFRNLIKVKLLPHYYLNTRSALRAIQLNIPKDKWKWHKVMKGGEIKDFMLVYRMSQGLGHFTKYRYTPNMVTKQEQKNHRTQTRRRLRKIGLLTRVQPKQPIRNKPPVIKETKGVERRKVNNPRATIIQIERKPEKYYYVVKKRVLSQKRGKLFKIKGLRFNVETGEIIRYCIHTLRTDVYIPYLKSHLQKLINEKIQKGNQTTDYFRRFRI